jgi:hypothetical protein
VHIGCISICCTYEKPSKINLAQDALDGMAYYIFLKSLGSLEEFRKKPHIKIPPKSPPTNFQSLGIFKNLIFIRKRIFLQLSAQTAQQPSGLLAPSGPASRAGPPGCAPFPSSLPHPSWRLRRLFLLRCRAMATAPPFSYAMERPQQMPLP